jgi:hypothetical protein
MSEYEVYHTASWIAFQLISAAVADGDRDPLIGQHHSTGTVVVTMDERSHLATVF